MSTKIILLFTKQNFLLKSLLTLFFLSISILSYSEKLKEIKLENYKSISSNNKNDESFKEAIKNFNISIENLKNKKKELNPLTITLSGGFNGDKAENQEKYLINVKSNLKYQQILNIFILNMETTVQLKDGSLEENVKNLELSYQHNLINNLELFGFIKRLADSYMSIDERYEAGGGLKFKLPVMYLKKFKNEKIHEQKLNFTRNYKYLHRILKNPNIDKEEKWSLKKNINSVDEEFDKIYRAFKNKNAILMFEIETAILAEFDKAEIKTFLDDVTYVNDTETVVESKELKKFSLDGELNYRLQFGLGLTCKPLSTLTLHSKITKKINLKDGYLEEDPRDFRTEFNSYFKVILKKKEGSPKETSLVFGYKKEYDNSPSRIPDSIIDLNAGVNKKLRNIIAASKHEKFTFSILFKF